MNSIFFYQTEFFFEMRLFHNSQKFLRTHSKIIYDLIEFEF